MFSASIDGHFVLEMAKAPAAPNLLFLMPSTYKDGQSACEMARAPAVPILLFPI